MTIALAYDNPEDGGTTGQDGTNQSSSLSAATTFPTGTNLLTIKSIDASGHTAGAAAVGAGPLCNAGLARLKGGRARAER